MKRGKRGRGGGGETTRYTITIIVFAVKTTNIILETAMDHGLI
jgi:hypothetical protein